MSMDSHAAYFQSLERERGEETKEADGQTVGENPERQLVITLLSHLLSSGRFTELAVAAGVYINNQGERLEPFLILLEEAMAHSKKWRHK